MAAANPSHIYVSTHGNDSWNGLNSTWTSGLNGPKATIKNAILNVATNGTVHVASGTYRENGTIISKNVTIIGGNQKTTIINGNGLMIFTIESGKVTLSNLKIMNGYYTYGGAICNFGTLTLNNSTLVNNTVANEGGAIYNAGTATLNNCTIQNSAAMEDGGAIYNTATATLNINNCTIQNSKATYNGGVLFNNGTATINYSKLQSNTAMQNGGAIYNSKTATINYSTLQFNTAIEGGAIYNKESGNVTVNNCILQNNTATNNGGTINNDGTATLSTSTLQNNTAKDNGGAIYNTENLTINKCILQNNTAQYSGGAIYNAENLNLTNSTLQNNTSTEGGAVYNNGNVDIKNSKLQNNNAQYGGAIFSNKKMTVSNSTVKFNTAKQGGAFYNTGTLSVSGSKLNNNAADVGSVLYNINTATLNYNQLVGNNPSNYVIYSTNTEKMVDALYNWWGSNSAPSSYVNSNVNVTSWMVLKVSSVTKILKGHTGLFTATLCYDNLNNYHNPNAGHVPDGILAVFTGSLGTFKPNNSYFINGVATSTFTGNTVGTAVISTVVDSQTVKNSIIITALPTVTASPTGGSYNATQKVILTLNKKGNIYYTLNGSTPTIKSRPYISPITIASNTLLKYIAVDLDGNISPVYTQKYIIDRLAPRVISTTPKQLAKGVFKTAAITIKFSENIKASTNYTKITLKTLATRKTTTVNLLITNNILTIKHGTNLRPNTTYMLTIPSRAIQDKAGNKLQKTYTLKFKTRN